jgi:hypothetical protein
MVLKSGGDGMDDEFCRERARTVRALAEEADPFIKRRLLQLAHNYERRITQPANIKDDKTVGASQTESLSQDREERVVTNRMNVDRD